MNYLKFKKEINNSEKRIIELNRKNFFDKYANFISIIIALAALAYTVWRTETTIKMAKESNEESQRSSQLTQDLARATISYLESISKSSDSLNNNMGSFSRTLIPLNKNLLDLTNNLVSVNQLSNNQLKELTKIIERLTSVNEKLLSINQELDSTNKSITSRKPRLIAYVDCDNSKNVFEIYLENIGSLRAKMDLEFNFRGTSWNEYGISLNAGERKQLDGFTKKEYFEGDSTAVGIKVYYYTESGDQSFNLNLEYVKCR